MPICERSKSCDAFTFRAGQLQCQILLENVELNTSICHREDYQSYNRLAGSIRSLLHRLSQLPAQDPFRSKMEASLLSKLYDMALVDAAASITDVDKKITVSAFCRRRLAVIMCKLKMCQTVKMAVQFIEQGHVRIGPDTMTDPAFLVTRFVICYVD